MFTHFFFFKQNMLKLFSFFLDKTWLLWITAFLWKCNNVLIAY